MITMPWRAYNYAVESKVKGLSRLLWDHELSMMALVRLGK